MWSDRFVVYYSREMHFAVRWRHWGQSESEAPYRRFDNRVEAERLFNALNLARRRGLLAPGPIEMFKSQAKWVRVGDCRHDETGVVEFVQMGLFSGCCKSGEHDDCVGSMVVSCSCGCHVDDLNELID